MDKDEFKAEAGRARDRALKAKKKLDIHKEKKQLAQQQHETTDMVRASIYKSIAP
jgi:hypothetical protein